MNHLKIASCASCLFLFHSTLSTGQEPPDQSEILQKQVRAQNGSLILDAGDYYLDQTIEFDLARLGAAAIKCNGPVTIHMRGAGPAFRFIGTHEGTAGPATFKPETWKERMPIIEGMEILGHHPEADGIELFQTMQAIVSKVAVRKCRHGIHLVTRNRNVLISDCHLYENSGVGIYLDDVNLHQINVANCHISYNREGGIVVRDGNVRNLQIANCDLEGNMPADSTETNTANIFIDLSSRTGGRSVAEVAITGCTIQHSARWGKEGKIAPGGANIRLLGKAEYPIDNVTIGQNVMSDTSLSVHMKHVKDVALTGNTFFTSEPRDLLIEHSLRVNATGNVFNPRQPDSVGGLIIRDSSHCIVADTTVHAIQDPRAALLLERCRFSRVSNVILSDSAKGIVLRDCEKCVVKDCTITGLPEGVEAVAEEGGQGNVVSEILK